MKELNKHILNDALKKLPGHEPPSFLWEKIEFDLEGADESQRMQESLMVLPEYDPPDTVWEGIENNLHPKAKIVKMPIWRRYASIAAIGVIIFATFWMFQTETIPEGVLSYSQEEIEDRLLAHDWDEDEDAFQDFMNICETKKFVCETPEFVNLKTEFLELNDAKLALKEAIGAFGTNPDLIIQMKEIELERTDLFKTMIAMVI